MRARLRQMATPRKLVAAECCVAVLAAAIAVSVGATPLALALIGLCILTMAPALVLVGRLDRRGPND